VTWPPDHLRGSAKAVTMKSSELSKQLIGMFGEAGKEVEE
jgi:hypothetical protein